jgi:hypothetical protein
MLGTLSAKGKCVVKIENVLVAEDNDAGDRFQRLHETALIQRDAYFARTQSIEQLFLPTDMPAAISRTESERAV